MRRPHKVADELGGGDLRSIGRADQVARRAASRPALLRQLVDGMTHADPIVRARCADAAEKATRSRPALLARHKAQLLRLSQSARQQEVRWHVAQMLPRLRLTTSQARSVLRTLGRRLGHDRSTIVRVFSLQAMADVAMRHAGFRQAVVRRVRHAAAGDRPALISRATRLAQGLDARAGRARTASRESGRRAS